jgi:hypothetical protein
MRDSDFLSKQKLPGDEDILEGESGLPDLANRFEPVGKATYCY